MVQRLKIRRRYGYGQACRYFSLSDDNPFTYRFSLVVGSGRTHLQGTDVQEMKRDHAIDGNSRSITVNNTVRMILITEII